MHPSKEALLAELKRDSFSPGAFVESKLQPVITSSRLRSLGPRELDDIRAQVRAERRFLEELGRELEQKKAATAKRDQFHEKFTYNNLKVP